MPFGTYDLKSGDRGLSSKLWLGVNPDVVRNDPRQGMFFLEDFYGITAATANATIDGWKAIETTAGRILEVDDEEYGVIAIGGADGTDNNGQALYKTGVTVAPAAGKTIVFETRCKAETIGTGLQFFAGLGLATLDTAPLASGAVAAGLTDYIGFHTADNAIVSLGAEDGGSAGTATAAHTFVSDTYVKLGFRVNGVDSIDLFVDGEKVDNTLVADDICEGTVLRLTLANYSEGNDASLASFDWVAVGVV